MARLLLIVAGIALVFWLLKSYRKALRHGSPPPAAGEDMVRCAQCGVHLPKSESIASRDEYFCCDEHRRLRQH